MSIVGLGVAVWVVVTFDQRGAVAVAFARWVVFGHRTEVELATMLERADVVLSQRNPVVLNRVWVDIFSQRGRVVFVARPAIDELSVPGAVVLRNSGVMEGSLDWVELVLDGAVTPSEVDHFAEAVLLTQAFEVVTTVAVLTA